MPLTDAKCRNSKAIDKQQKLFDGNGLYLLLRPNGSKLWQMKYRYQGKEKTASFGAYPVTSLSEARKKCDEVRQLLREGSDPSEAKKKCTLGTTVADTFESIGEEWLSPRINDWSESHRNRTTYLLRNDIYPVLADLSLREIKPNHIIEVIRKIESRGALDMAAKALEITSRIFRYGIIVQRCEYDVTAGLRGILKPRKVQHMAYLREHELPEFFIKLEAYEGQRQTKLALKLVVLTMLRTTELRSALWHEIDWNRAELRIPPKRMKTNVEHVVPLTEQSLALLSELQRRNIESKYLFPIQGKPEKHMSENAMLYALYRMGYHSRATVHGFRATASTILNERVREHGFHPDIIERQLAHTDSNKIRASYNHAEYLHERRLLLEWWSSYLVNAGLRIP